MHRSVCIRRATVSAEFTERARNTLSKAALGQPGMDVLTRRRDWLQLQVNNFRLSTVLEESARSAINGSAEPPLVMMYGSSVAGTAFAHADADFALVFPSSFQPEQTAAAGSSPADLQEQVKANGGSVPVRAFRSSCGFLTIDREVQPLVLGAVYDNLVSRGAIGDRRVFSLEGSSLQPEGGEHHSNVEAVQAPPATASGEEVKLQRIFRARIPILQCIPPTSATELLLTTAGVGSSSGNSNNTEPDGSSADKKVPTLLAASTPAPAPLRLATRPGTKAPPSYLVHSSPAALIKKGLHFDLSLSLDGCKNSLLLRQYMERYPRLRGATLLLKRWARRNRILNARRGWISPYALTVMVIHYMHATGRIAELIPTDAVNSVLETIANESAVGEVTLLDAPSCISRCVHNDKMTRVLPAEPMLTAVDDIFNDMQGFFEFYCGATAGSPSFEFDVDVADIRASNRVATKEQWLATSVKQGGLLELSEKERWHQIGYGVMMLRDPYEGHSLGRSVEFFRAESIRESFRLAALSMAPDEFFYEED